MYYTVKSAEELFAKNNDLSKLFFARAINNHELEQLVKDGPENFYFDEGTNYEKVVGNMIAKHGRLRSGTVIVYNLNNSDDNSNDKKFEIGEAFVKCKEDFYGSVEVYNINGLNWEGIVEYYKKYVKRLE